MINIKHFLDNFDQYQNELTKRGKNIEWADDLKISYEMWKEKQSELDTLRATKNEFNNKVVSLEGDEKMQAIGEMKEVSTGIKSLEEVVRELKKDLTNKQAKLPTLGWEGMPIGKSDADNPVIEVSGDKRDFSFEIKPYYELDLYKKYVDSDAGANSFGSRGYYMKGQVARFQKVLFDWAEERAMELGQELGGFEYMYVPLLMNEKSLLGTGHLPDFDGQMYVIPEENGDLYLVPSSEPPMMSYYNGKHVGHINEPILMLANTTCFRREAGSYGKDQKGILRVHQFEKIEMNSVCRPEDNDKVFDLFSKVNETLYSELGLHFRAVEVCSGDIPDKHYRQTDYEAWFPGEGKYREVCSNGSAGDYQSHGMTLTYTNQDGEKANPWTLNCTAMTFRTGLAIMEQFQEADGRVKLPEVIAKRMGVEYLE